MTERFERHLEQHTGAYLLLSSAVYFVLTGLVAAKRPFWYDEFFTFHIARLTDAAGVLRALRDGADIHPPLDYLLRHASIGIFGAGELADRLPSLVAYWLLCLCLYRIVAVRCGRIFGLMAFLGPNVTLAYEYAYEGRAYAPMLAGSAVAFLAWQALLCGERRRLHASLLWAGATIAVAVHYYGLFVYVPLLAGEAWRSVVRRKIDGLALGAIGLSLVGFALNLPFLSVQLEAAGTPWMTSSLYQTAGAYWWLLNDAVQVLPFLLLLGAMALLWDRTPIAATGPRPAAIPREEIFAAASMLFIPFVCFLVAELVTGVFLYRYTMLALIGVIIVGLYLLHSWLPNRSCLRLAFLLALACGSLFVMARTNVESDRADSGSARHRRLDELLAPGDLPIVYGVRADFMEAVFYGDPELQERRHYLVNARASLERIGNDNGQLAMRQIAPYVGGKVTDYDAFLHGHETFMLVSPWASLDWLLPQLLDDGVRIRHRAVTGNDLILEVVVPSVEKPDEPRS